MKTVGVKTTSDFSKAPSRFRFDNIPSRSTTSSPDKAAAEADEDVVDILVAAALEEVVGLRVGGSGEVVGLAGGGGGGGGGESWLESTVVRAGDVSLASFCGGGGVGNGGGEGGGGVEELD